MAPLRSGAHLIAMTTMALLVVVMGIFHKTRVIDLSQIDAGTAQQKRTTGTSSDASVAIPNSTVYCDRNSKQPYCCSKQQCQLVHKSTLYSECCNNVPTKVTTHNHHRHRHRSLQLGLQLPSQPPVDANPLATSRPRPVAAVARPRSSNSKKNKLTKRQNRPSTIVRRTPQIYPLLITATPRSGTVFTQRLLTQLGVRVANDQNDPQLDGMVSWMHVFNDALYFGPARIRGSKFRAVWHQVRDPLKALTSMAFTEPLAEENSHSNHYVRFLNRHIKLTKKDDLQAILLRQQQENATSTAAALKSLSTGAKNQTAVNLLLKEQFLIYRGLEFYTQWHRYILSLQLPRLCLEDITERQNMTLLDDIFASIGKPPPNHSKAKKIIAADRRRQLQRQLQQQRRRQLHTNSRKHRPTLEWRELCRVSVERAREFLRLSHELGYYLETQQVC